MGYHDREEAAPAPEPREPLALAQALLTIAVRLVGVALLLVGLWAGINVVLEAWKLYEDPARVERFARAIEEGSNLDKTLSAITAPETPRERTALPASPEAPAPGAAPAPAPEAGPASIEGLRFSYFLAWIVVLLLLVVIGGLAMSAVSTGGRLALYDAQVRRLSRQVVREVRDLKRAA